MNRLPVVRRGTPRQPGDDDAAQHVEHREDVGEDEAAPDVGDGEADARAIGDLLSRLEQLGIDLLQERLLTQAAAGDADALAGLYDRYAAAVLGLALLAALFTDDPLLRRWLPAGAAYTLKADEHVRVDVFYRAMSERGRAEAAGQRTGFTSDRFRIRADRSVKLEGPGEPPEEILDLARSGAQLAGLESGRDREQQTAGWEDSHSWAPSGSTARTFTPASSSQTSPFLSGRKTTTSPSQTNWPRSLSLVTMTSSRRSRSP